MEQRMEQLKAVPIGTWIRTFAPLGIAVILAQACVVKSLCPFAAAFCTASYLQRKGGNRTAIGCVVGACFASREMMFLTLFNAPLQLGMQFIAEHHNRTVAPRIRYTLLLAAVCGTMYVRRDTWYGILITLLEGTLAVACTFIFTETLRGLSALERKAPLKENEVLAVIFGICALLMGLASVSIMSMNAMRMGEIAILMALACCMSPPLLACIGLALGFCATLCGGATALYIGNMGICALIAGYCGRMGKGGAILGFMLCNALFTVYINANAQAIIPLGELMVAGALCAAVPQSWLDALGAMFRRSRTLLDVPRSAMLQRLVSEKLFRLSKAMKQTSRVLGKETDAQAQTVLLAEQSAQTAELLKKTARQVEQGSGFDDWAERTIAQRLRLAGVDVLGVAVREEDGLVARVETRACGGHGVCQKMMQKAVSAACGVEMRPLERPCCGAKRNKCVMGYAQVFPLSMQGGAACVQKEGESVCGDVVSSVHLQGGRELICLCDGMGSGEQAAQTAQAAAQLIEDYFMAGYEEKDILPMVNRILTMRQKDVFAAVDLCLIDLNKQRCHFIKTCAAPSFLIRRGIAESIAQGALPIGIVDSVQPAMMQRDIAPGDTIVLLSDGVADMMKPELVSSWLLQATTAPDAHAAAGRLVDLAMEQAGGAKDDMTAIVLRIKRTEKAKVH